MPANLLFHTWFERVWQLLPDERIARLRNLVWLMVGICQCRSVHLRDTAEEFRAEPRSSASLDP